jgi:predicted nucleic acid-binding protein
MSDPVFHFVMDASVGIKLFVEEEFSDKSEQLIKHPSTRLFIPDLFYIECANILTKYTRRFGRSAQNARQDLADLRQLVFDVTPTFELMEDALSVALEYSLSAYDACYAVLAQRLDIPLVTADRRLAESIPSAMWIGDVAWEQ